MTRLAGLVDRQLGSKNPNNVGTFQCVGTKRFDDAHWLKWAEATLRSSSSCGFARERAAAFLESLKGRPLREPGQDDEEAAA